MLKTEIPKDEPLYPGDRIQLTFKAFGPAWVYLRATELAILKWQLSEKNPDWELTGWDSTTYPDKLVLEFLILDPSDVAPQVQKASVITPLIIAGAVLGTAAILWLSLDKVEKITDSPAGKVALAGAGSLGIAALFVAVLLLLRYYRE